MSCLHILWVWTGESSVDDVSDGGASGGGSITVVKGSARSSGHNAHQMHSMSAKGRHSSSESMQPITPSESSF
eukprot:m.400629 g.400629  ORF g.400629 m.400629 type:complete len:73 (-) comp21162_c0_seq1:114-332(-)